MPDHYFSIDGSSLLSEIKKIKRARPEFRDKKFSLPHMVRAFSQWQMHSLHDRSYRRFTFYFANGDNRIEQELILPEFTNPGSIEDVRIERCGKSIRDNRRANQWLDENGAPEYVTECFHRSEKAVDTQICVDALQLAAVQKIDRLFLLTNDSDFLPLCKTLRQLGINISLIRLTKENVNRELVEECDTFDIMNETYLVNAFIAGPSNADQVQ